MTIDRSAVFQERIPEAYVALVTIEHPAIDPPIRATTNSSNLISNGETFLASRINLSLPTDKADGQNAQITVANVDRRIGLAAELMVTPAQVTFQVVNAEDPDTVEIDYPPLRLTSITANAMSVSGELTVPLNPQNAYPRTRATKTLTPAIYLDAV